MKNDYEKINIINVKTPNLENLYKDAEKLKLKKKNETILTIGSQKLGLKTIIQTEYYLYYQEIVHRTNELNTVDVDYARSFWENQDLIPKDWEDYELVFKTIFKDESDYPYIVILKHNNDKKMWHYYFIGIGSFTTPPQNARFVCFVV